MSAIKLTPILIDDTEETHIDSIEEQYRKVLVCESCESLDVYLRMCTIENMTLNQICPFKYAACPKNKW